MIFPIPPRITYGQDEMAYWDNFLTEQEINFILSQPEWLNTEQGSIGGSNGESLVNPGTRKSSVAWIDGKPEMIPIWNKLANVVAEINRRYFHFDLTGFHEPMQLSVYSAKDGGHYDWHVDACSKDIAVPRKLSMSLLLSDTSEFEGGQFQVKTVTDNAQTLETKRGRAWFFPSYMLHRVAPVTKGVRRSLVIWVGGPSFK